MKETWFRIFVSDVNEDFAGVEFLQFLFSILRQKLMKKFKLRVLLINSGSQIICYLVCKSAISQGIKDQFACCYQGAFLKPVSSNRIKPKLKRRKLKIGSARFDDSDKEQIGYADLIYKALVSGGEDTEINLVLMVCRKMPKFKVGIELCGRSRGTLDLLEQALKSLFWDYKLKRVWFAKSVLGINLVLRLWSLSLKDFAINGLRKSQSKFLPLLDELSEKGVKLGVANGMGRAIDVRLAPADRRRHIYLIGKTGVGKSSLILNMLTQDIAEGKGCALIDPHGDLADAVIKRIPRHRINDLVYFDPADLESPFGINLFSDELIGVKSLVASAIVATFKKMYSYSWGPRLEYILRNTILSLLQQPNANLLLINRVLTDVNYRAKLVDKIEDPVLSQFWNREFNCLNDRQRTEAIAPIQNKIGQFLANSVVRNILGQVRSSVSLRFVMDSRKIFIANLSKGRLGEDNSMLLGSMLVTQFQLAAMSRFDLPENRRIPFYLYIDEFQNFVTDAFATILAEVRKYGLCLTLANQYLAQLPDETISAVLGNVGSILAFRLGPSDANLLSQQFGSSLDVEALQKLDCFKAYAQILQEGRAIGPFSLTTEKPMSVFNSDNLVNKAKRISKERYCRQRYKVEAKIKKMLA